MMYTQDRPNENGQASANPKPAKRARVRVSVACLACRTRRSKCDLIDHLGCHRCKQLKTICSLRSSTVLDDTMTSDPEARMSLTGMDVIPPADSSNQTVDRTRQLELAVAYLRDKSAEVSSPPQFDYTQRSFTLGSSSGSLDPSMATGVELPTTASNAFRRRIIRSTRGEVRDGKGESERDDTWFHRWADPETFSLIHRGIQSKAEEGLGDPVSEGVISEGQAEAYYQLFKFRFAAVHPHPTLLLMHTAVPTHPFLLSASLYYAIQCDPSLSLLNKAQTQHLELILLNNLNAYHSGCRPSVEGIMAAFILSYLPVTSSEMVKPDAFRMIGLAYSQVRELGQSIFLDRLLQYLEIGTPTEHLESQLNDARVFISVINRSAWFAHSRAPWASLPVLMENAQHRILAVLKERNLDCALDRHLILEQVCLTVLNNHARTWQTLQRKISPDIADIHEGNALVESSLHQLEDVIMSLDSYRDMPSASYLRCHVIYCMWWVTVRNVWSIYRLPFPIFVSNVYESWLDAMRLAAKAASRMLVECLRSSWKLGCLPSAIGNAIVLCFAAIATATIHLQHYNRQIPPELDISDTLVGIRRIVASSGFELDQLLSRTRGKLDEYRSQLALQRDMAASDHQVDQYIGQQYSMPSATSDRAGFGAGLGGDAGERERNLNFAGLGDAAASSNLEFDHLFSGLEGWWSWPVGPVDSGDLWPPE